MVGVGECDRCGAVIEHTDIPRGPGLITCPDCGKVLGDKCTT